MLTCSMCGCALEPNPELVRKHYDDKHPQYLSAHGSSFERYADDYKTAMRKVGEDNMRRSER